VCRHGHRRNPAASNLAADPRKKRLIKKYTPETTQTWRLRPEIILPAAIPASGQTSGLAPVGQAAPAGALKLGSSVNGERWFPGSCSGHAARHTHRSARADGANEAGDGVSVGEMPTTSVWGLISPFNRSRELVTGMKIAVSVVWLGAQRSRRMVRRSGTRDTWST
jgi:hypothetical protein